MGASFRLFWIEVAESETVVLDLSICRRSRLGSAYISHAQDISSIIRNAVRVRRAHSTHTAQSVLSREVESVSLSG